MLSQYLSGLLIITLFVIGQAEYPKRSPKNCQEIAPGSQNRKIGTKCYFIVKLDTGRVWHDARRHCNAFRWIDDTGKVRKGRLAHFRHNRHDLLDKMAAWTHEVYGGCNNCLFWVGLKQVSTNDEPAGGWGWMASNGKHDVYQTDDETPWFAGRNEPDDSDGSQNCGILVTDRATGVGLEDNNCAQMYDHICETPAP